MSKQPITIKQSELCIALIDGHYELALFYGSETEWQSPDWYWTLDAAQEAAKEAQKRFGVFLVRGMNC